MQHSNIIIVSVEYDEPMSYDPPSDVLDSLETYRGHVVQFEDQAYVYRRHWTNWMEDFDDAIMKANELSQGYIPILRSSSCDSWYSDVYRAK